MIPAQRRRDILRLIATRGAGTITELSRQFNVSEMTIRRDLKTLEEEGYLVYTHGGAIAIQNESSGAEPRYIAKKRHNMERKARIARYAAQHFVQHNDIIILEAGTTVGAMLPHLATKDNLTIVTNGLYTIYEARNLLANSHLICTGGILRDVSYTFVGPLAEGFFQEFFARKVFLSAIGFTLETGLTDPQMIDTQVKKAMIAAADQVIVLLDSSKFGVKSFTSVIRPSEIDALITDEGAPPMMLDALRELGVAVYVVSEGAST